MAVNQVVSDSEEANTIKATMSVLAPVLGLVAAVGVFSIMLLHVRERSRDIGILKAVGMSPRQLLTMIMTTSAVLGVVGGLLGMPAGVRTYHALMPQLARETCSSLPPFIFDVFQPIPLYLLGLTGLAIALVGAFLPARRATRSRAAETLRSG